MTTSLVSSAVSAPVAEQPPEPFFPFDDKPINPARVEKLLSQSSGFVRDAIGYQAEPGLREVLWAGWLLQRPVLLRGVPGSGKSTAAYWAALKLLTADAAGDSGAELPIRHVQVRSTTTAQELKYEFDHLLRLRDAHASVRDDKVGRLEAKQYVRPGPLWHAFDRYSPRQSYVVLLDEFDKAARDLPNDLLYELDKFEFEVPELPSERRQITIGIDRVTEIPGYHVRDGAWPKKQNLYVVTSNDERTLPPAFLRRCLHYKFDLDEGRITKILKKRFAKWEGRITDIKRISDFLRDQKKVPDPQKYMSFSNRIAWLSLLAQKPSIQDDATSKPAAPVETKPISLREILAIEHLSVLLDPDLRRELERELEDEQKRQKLAGGESGQSG